MARNKLKLKHKNKVTRRTGYKFSDFNSSNLDSRAYADITRLGKPFRLLDLPDELVVKVIEFAIVISSIDEPIRLDKALLGIRISGGRPALKSGSHKLCAPYRDETIDLVQPAITRTTKMLRHEGLKIFYSQNVFFTISQPFQLNALAFWLQALGQSNILLLSSLFVAWEMMSPLDQIARAGKTGLQDMAGKDLAKEAMYWLGHRPGSCEPVILLPAQAWIKLEHGKVLLRRCNNPDSVIYSPTESCFEVKFAAATSESSPSWVSLNDIAANKGIDRNGKDFWVYSRSRALCV